MNSTSNRKGPAEAATSPDQGPNNLRQENQMNTNRDSTKPDIAARTVELEAALHDLRNMAAIASELATDDLGSSHKRVTGSDVLYHLSLRQRDRLLFAIFHVSEMTDELLAAFNRKEVSA